MPLQGEPLNAGDVANGQVTESDDGVATDGTTTRSTIGQPDDAPEPGTDDNRPRFLQSLTFEASDAPLAQRIGRTPDGRSVPEPIRLQ